MAVAEQILHLRPIADGRPDRALVYEAQHGRPEAATVLIERYYPRIYSFVSHLTYGRANVEDLTQEVFARALKALVRFNGQYQFEHWLLRIAKNLCIDEARRNMHSAEPTDPVELPELKGIPAPDYVWESVSRELVASVVHRALSALPPRQRAILVMREMEGMSYADIAQVVGTNPRGVEATLRRARDRFRMEVSRAESAEEANAACRRVVRLVSDDPHASQSTEAASHLASCADCRRRTRTMAPVTAPVRRAFGFLPLFGFGSLFRRSGTGTVWRRASDRVRESFAVAGLGSSAAVGVPLARLAEVAGGVFVATAVAFAPALPAFHTARAAVPGYVAEPVQVDSVAPVSLLFRSSPAGPVTAVTGRVQSSTFTTPAPSLVGPSSGASATSDLLSQLGLAPGQNVLGTTLNNLASIGNILADQLQQVGQLTNSAVNEASGVLGPLAPVTTPVTAPVTKSTADLTNGVSGTLKGVANQTRRAAS